MGLERDRRDTSPLPAFQRNINFRGAGHSNFTISIFNCLGREFSPSQDKNPLAPFLHRRNKCYCVAARCAFQRGAKGDPAGHEHVRLCIQYKTTCHIRRPSSRTTFDNFYQSQILWDETMAHSAAAFLKENPEYQLVVLAGEEHIMYGSWIPHRLNRLRSQSRTESGRCYCTSG
jgi:hypothetical protein